MKPNQFDLLQDEATTSAGLISSGLSLLKRMDFTRASYQYQAFFSLSVGIERMTKLILIYDYLLDNRSFPSNKYLKDNGHNVDLLLSKCKAIGLKYNTLRTNIDDPIILSIIRILSKFGEQSRYYNLNFLTGVNKGENCLQLWEKEVNLPILKRHFDVGDAYSEEDLAIDPKGKNDIEYLSYLNWLNWARKGKFHKEKADYSTLYTYKIINHLYFISLEVSSTILPRFHEHFQIFSIQDDEYVLAKQSWDHFDLS